MRLPSPLLLLLLASACASAGPADVDDREPSARRQLTDAPPLLTVEAEASAVTLSLAASHLVDSVRLEDPDGELSLSATPSGAVALEHIELRLGDIRLGSGVWPDGVRLREVTVSTRERHWLDDVQWLADDACEGTVEVELHFEAELWVKDDVWLPLTIPAELSLDVFVYREGDLLRGELHGTGASGIEGRTFPIELRGFGVLLEVVEDLPTDDVGI